jgi:hypothetical protein
MHDLGEEAEKHVIRTARQPEPRIDEDPVIFPVIVGDTVLGDVPAGTLEAMSVKGRFSRS